MKFSSKEEPISSIESEHRRFLQLLGTIPSTRYLEPGVWGDDWNIRDLLAHLTAWEQMFLTWYRQGEAGEQPEMPAKGYKWNQTPALNREIWKRHRGRSVAEIRAEFETSFDEVFSLAQGLTEFELLERGHFSWTGRNHLTTYLGANTVSHYRAATKILRRWLRTQSRILGTDPGESP